MTAYIARRIVHLVPVLLLVSAIVFFLFHVMPGDAAVIMMGGSGETFDQESLAALRKTMGLDQPLWIQYLLWLGNAVRGDLGVSYINHQPVTSLLLEKLPISLELALMSLLVSLVISIPAGIVSALWRGSWLDQVTRVLALLGFCVPRYWLAILLIMVFAVQARWFPPAGFADLLQDPARNLQFLVLLAMRPDPGLADLFGLAHEGTRQERLLQYLAVEPASEIARGIERTSLQYHGEADEYRLEGASPIAWLCDGDDVGFDAFDQVMRAVEECDGHFSAYLLGLEGDPTRDQVVDWIARGHEVGLHVDDTAEAARTTSIGMRSAYARATEGFASLYGRRHGPSARHHWLLWHGWVDAAEIAVDRGIHVDFNFYHGRQWKLPDGGWVQGYYTGSGLPQRYVKEDGNVLDIFQLLTQWADETQLYRQGLGTEGATQVVREMLDAAELGYYTFFVANFHPGGWKARQTEPWARNMMREAARRGIPIWSGEDLYRFLAAREAQRLSGHRWDGAQSRFNVDTPEPDRGLTPMLPASFGARRLLSIACNGSPAAFAVERIAGRDHALFAAPVGHHEFRASYTSSGTLQ